LLLDRVACRLHGLDECAEPLTIDAWLSTVVQADRVPARAMLVTPNRPADLLRQTVRFAPGGGLKERTLEFVLQGSSDGQRLVGACVDGLAHPANPQPQTADVARTAWGKPDVMSRISHELRTPLNGVMGFAQLMALDQSHPLPPVQQHRLEILRQSGARLLSLIDQLLDVSRIEQGRLRLRSRPIDLRLLVERCAVEIMPLAQQRGIELRVEIPLSAPAVRADPEALEQVVTNLLSNAIKYNRPQGRVRIRFETVDQSGVLSVDDTGVGLSPRQIERLFEPFNRLAADGVDTKGGGLGLHIARKLLRAMGGDIDVLSQAGRGSRFAVSLPLARVESGRSTDQPCDPAQALLWSEGVEAVVLYVEHDDVSTALMQEIFAGQPAWRLLIAASGADALKLAQQVDVSLVLTDLNLPGMPGIDLRSRLKADPRTRQLRCIAFSADALPQQIERALAQGFDDYWTKPLDVEVLVAKLKYEFRALSELQGSNDADSCR
jgi:signal transduction histidine kinase